MAASKSRIDFFIEDGDNLFAMRYEFNKYIYNRDTKNKSRVHYIDIRNKSQIGFLYDIKL